MSFANDRAWVATRKGLFELRRGSGAHWRIERVSFLGEPVSSVLPPDGRGRMLAALNLGHFGVKLHASHDAGATWAETTTPAYPPQPDGAEGPAWTLLQAWVLERAGERVLAGTLPGGLFVSDDFGNSWQLNRPLWDRPERAEWFGGGYDTPGIHSICPHPSNADEWLLGVSCGGIWHTSDAGEGWTLRAEGLRAAYMPPERQDDPRIQDPHRIARCAAAPDVLWCQHHNGIWRSTDNALHWRDIHAAPLSNFGFAVAAHPVDPLTAWFVPGVADQQRVPVNGALAVQRTRDGGQSFEVLREGLPQADCYDLVYRHGLVVAEDGQHLPPIYTVRFG
ncbi:MAG: WD40/YVTN/BNR-like repeat-containing protein [Pseudomonadota bacterium]